MGPLARPVTLELAKAAEARLDPLEDLEIRLLLQAVYERYGYDFRDYALASLRRRVRQCMSDEKLSSVSALQARVLHEPGAARVPRAGQPGDDPVHSVRGALRGGGLGGAPVPEGRLGPCTRPVQPA